jgi:hypothetical protein
MINALDTMWVGPGEAHGEKSGKGKQQQEGDATAATAAAAGVDAAEAGQQAARLQAVLEGGDPDEVFVQVRRFVTCIVPCGNRSCVSSH